MPKTVGVPVKNTMASTRAGRQARIIGLLIEHRVHSQPQLLELLAAEGIAVTQATLSRDLDELGAVKLRAVDGGQGTYVIPEDGSPVKGVEGGTAASRETAQRTVGICGSMPGPGGVADSTRGGTLPRICP